MLNKFKTAFVLLLIGAFSGGLIYIVNDITAPIIAANEEARKVEFYSEIFGVDKEVGVNYEECSVCPEGLDEIVISSKDNQVLGVVYFGSTNNSYGQVDVMVGINNDGTIAMVVIAGSTNTPNFVKKIEKEYLSQFTNQTADPETVEFDSSTGASYTYGSVQEIVEKAVTAYTEGSAE